MEEKISVAIISDTHAHLDERIAELIRECDFAIHAGDICGETILSEMQPKTGKVLAVSGNNDPYCHKTDLPEITSIEMPGGKITVEHGHKHGHRSPCHDSLRKHHPEARLIVYGHTHKLVIDKTTTPWVINPGAAGQTRTHGGPSCLVLECSDASEWLVKTHRFQEV
ncbi:MAG TPA: metallophosphoesterase [Chromatiales bacterium]|nr:metallophosphoesterase [Thiotrichales bacterium]HIP67347.1 metallophosphoesterase [Chromatiales bacterium]